MLCLMAVVYLVGWNYRMTESVKTKIPNSFTVTRTLVNFGQIWKLAIWKIYLVVGVYHHLTWKLQ